MRSVKLNWSSITTTGFLAVLEGVMVDEPSCIEKLWWRVGWYHDQFCLSKVELKVLVLHPARNVPQTGCNASSYCRIIWLEREVELSVISIAVIRKTMFLNDRSQWWHVDGEEKWSKHWALRNPSSKKLWLRNLTPPRHPEEPIWEVRLEPQERGSLDAHLSESGQEDLMDLVAITLDIRQ